MPHLPLYETAVVDTSTLPKKRFNWCLAILYSASMAIGSTGGPLLQRLYYNHGGSSKWLSSFLQSVGFLTLLPPLTFLYFQHRFASNLTPKVAFFLEPKVVLSSASIGVFVGLLNYLYSTGLSSLPVSTATILFSTQLAFTALFARFIVKQKITVYSLNAIVVIILGVVVLALHTSSDKPPGETRKTYLLGFFLTLLGGVVQGLMYPLTESSYSMSSRPMNYVMVFQYQFVMFLFASLFAIAGMLISKDYRIIAKEVTEFGLGAKMYVVIIVASAVVWQFASLGTMGIISCTSALFAGIMGSVLIPVVEISSVIAFGENFSGSKGLSLTLCIWGFISYFFGEYRMTAKQKTIAESG